VDVSSSIEWETESISGPTSGGTSVVWERGGSNHLFVLLQVQRNRKLAVDPGEDEK